MIIFNKRPDAASRLLELAKSNEATTKTPRPPANEWRHLPVNDRLSHALLHGITEYIERY